MNPSKKLHEFLTSMLEWETTLDKQKKTKDYKNNSEVRSNILQKKGEELLHIFKNHLTSRALRTIAKGRLDILATARPPRVRPGRFRGHARNQRQQNSYLHA
ncbi:hypothetical protein [Pseudomonas sp. S37]|uniref:hypothetical protein n=1 Tax=Pseudomonas sp. S37 TaxID=2767449 RepID=UPI00191391C5|nr:hypothetical protein [Pseudomonas sp. S37]